nr:EOG090X07KR [Eulimnadia texana]
MSHKLGTVVIGGGTGFIGSILWNQLMRKGYNIVVVSRRPGPYCITWGDLARDGLPNGTTAVVSLSGQNILDPARRWTPGFQQTVWASRVNTTSSLAQAIIDSKEKPEVFVSASGVGYYPPSPTAEYTEDSVGGKDDYFAKLCKEWEEAAKLPEDLGVRQVIVRIGVVLGRHGGMIERLYWPFFFGLGGPIGSGNQYFPWIHIDDIARLFVFAIQNNKVSGVLNGVAPDIVTNREFAKTFGRALWRPAVIPLPAFVVETMFGKERAVMMLQGQKVIPKRTQELGFMYKYPDIYSALKECSRLIYTPELMTKYRQP